MLKNLFGNETLALTLLLLDRKEKVCPWEVANGLEMPLNMVQKQLDRLEQGGFVQSGREGRQRVYRLNAGHPLSRELRDILARANALGPSDDPACGRQLTFEERLNLAESLWKDAQQLVSPRYGALNLTRTFNNFGEYHAWQKTQKII